MKATLLVFELAAVLLLLRLLDDWRLPRERILIYVWHPLTLWEFAGSGHVDAAVVTFVVLALGRDGIRRPGSPAARSRRPRS